MTQEGVVHPNGSAKMTKIPLFLFISREPQMPLSSCLFVAAPLILATEFDPSLAPPIFFLQPKWQVSYYFTVKLDLFPSIFHYFFSPFPFLFLSISLQSSRRRVSYVSSFLSSSYRKVSYHKLNSESCNSDYYKTTLTN